MPGPVIHGGPFLGDDKGGQSVLVEQGAFVKLLGDVWH